MNIERYYYSKITDIINERLEDNQIYVVQGINKDCLDLFDNEYIIDKNTFLSEKNSSFDETWCASFLLKLNVEKTYNLISYAQFTYLLNYIDLSFLEDKIIILEDNIRQLYPLDEGDYFEKTESEDIEKRHLEIPLHHAEQMKINNKYYYSVKSLSEKFKTIKIHNEELKLNSSRISKGREVIDISNLYSLDVFINDFIANNTNRKAFIKFHKKQVKNSVIEKILKNVNYILSLFDGELSLLSEVSVLDKYSPKDSSVGLFKKYWGDNATFRNLKIYQNPDTCKDIIDVSQGLIVDTIIEEYENSRVGKDVRDLFLTAPTGSGKSLLFQLPAFYVSENKDVTIVVSPLIALMKDQVKAIISERNYHKVAFINSELSLIDREKIIDKCKDGTIDILYMSPELLLSYDISHFIGERKLGLLVIDEAHLITTWGRDFRVDYWFLGNHIRKIRKQTNINFPMVAVTATAVYGGHNDMVFDSIDSLVMQNPHIFIGQVRRDDIEFVINNYDAFETKYEINKLKQTINFIKEVDTLGLKTLVYTPYTKHVKEILSKLTDKPNIALGYYGTLDISSKELAYRQFKNGNCKVMVSTKAFGMGIDISDIQVVYHHAPSGLLPDYIQEIGRVARNPEIKGYAVLNYSEEDKRFSNVLHEMSAIKPNQIKEVLRKIYKIYSKNKSKNLIISVDDFGHIFDNPMNIDQKVLTVLMMIEKDYLAKYRFNVLIGRPKKLNVPVYAKVSDEDFEVLNATFPNSITQESERVNAKIIKLDLDRIWQKNYRDKSFPILRRSFYSGRIFKDLNVKISAHLKVSFKRTVEYSYAHNQIKILFEALQEIFLSKEGYFEILDLANELNVYLKDEKKSNTLAEFIITTFSGHVVQQGVIEDNTFIQKKKSDSGYVYRCFNRSYFKIFTSMLKRFVNMFGGKDKPDVVDRYITNKGVNATVYIRLGYLFEKLEIGDFELKGGENPLVFIRINDPEILERDSQDPSYSNSILNRTLERHTLSNNIFDFFFKHSYNNEQRWSFIEDYFLGDDINILFEKYNTESSNKLNIAEYLKENVALPLSDIKVIEEVEEDNNIHVFEADTSVFYGRGNLLTITTDKGLETMKISKWLEYNPLALEMERKKHNLQMDRAVYRILLERLRINHLDYYKALMRLELEIEFRGYDRMVKAMMPYRDRPVDFYKWWSKDETMVKLSLREKIMLFDKVEVIKPGTLNAKHKRFLGK